MKSLHPKRKGLPQVPHGRSGELCVGLEVGEAGASVGNGIFPKRTQRCESVIISHPSWIFLSYLQGAKCGILDRNWHELTLRYLYMYWILKNLDHSLLAGTKVRGVAAASAPLICSAIKSVLFCLPARRFPLCRNHPFWRLDSYSQCSPQTCITQIQMPAWQVIDSAFDLGHLLFSERRDLLWLRMHQKVPIMRNLVQYAMRGLCSSCRNCCCLPGSDSHPKGFRLQRSLIHGQDTSALSNACHQNWMEHFCQDSPHFLFLPRWPWPSIGISGWSSCSCCGCFSFFASMARSFHFLTKSIGVAALPHLQASEIQSYNEWASKVSSDSRRISRPNSRPWAMRPLPSVILPG